MVKKITTEDVKRISHLACIKLSEDDMEYMTKELEDIVNFVEELKGINTDGMEPIINTISEKATFADDLVDMQETPESILKNAPKSRYGYFTVPKVIE